MSAPRAPDAPPTGWRGGVGGAPGTARLRAVAVATVDLERLAPTLGGSGDRLPDDDLLGARIAATGVAAVVVAEPRSEGRLAAALARHGEGPAALYLAVAPTSLRDVRARLEELGERSRDGEGPFGAEVLVSTRRRSGPFLLLVPGAPTADPSARRASATIAP